MLRLGAGSVKLSSYLGLLVWEHVLFTLEDWRLLSDELKVVLWKSIRKKQSADPSSISRVHVWIKSRTRKNSEPVTMQVGNTIEIIKKLIADYNLTQHIISKKMHFHKCWDKTIRDEQWEDVQP